MDDTDMALVVENDIQLDGLRVGGNRPTVVPNGLFEGASTSVSAAPCTSKDSQSMPQRAGCGWLARTTYDGDPMGEPTVLYEEVNPAFGAYNMTFTSPVESQPGGMVFYVRAVNLENGSTYTNPNYNTIRLIWTAIHPRAQRFTAGRRRTPCAGAPVCGSGRLHRRPGFQLTHLAS